MSKIKFKLVAYTDAAGKVNPTAPRNGNEDNMYVCSDLSGDVSLFDPNQETNLSKAGCLMVVADGMGGMNAGEVASEIAIEVVKASFAKDALPKSALETSRSRTLFMESVVVKADAAIKEHAKSHPECDGMGSTIIMTWLYDGQATITWCGDSRMYLWRRGDGLKQISKDHSYVQELVDAGKITEEEAFVHPYNNIITRSLGDPNHKAKPDSVTIPVCEGDILLLNSDGLSGVLRDAEMEKIIQTYGNDLNKSRQELWSAAEQADWYDNVTAILCSITSAPSVSTVKTGNEDEQGYIKISKKTLALASIFIVALLLLLSLLLLRSNKEKADDPVLDTEMVENGEQPSRDSLDVSEGGPTTVPPKRQENKAEPQVQIPKLPNNDAQDPSRDSQQATKADNGPKRPLTPVTQENSNTPKPPAIEESTNQKSTPDTTKNE